MSILIILSILLVSSCIVLFSIPRIIKVASIKHLFDDPSEDRKVHNEKTPNLGGIAIFAALILSICLFVPFSTTPYINFVIASSLILFTLGLKDDLVGLGPMIKFLAQIVAAVLIAYFADIRLSSFYGIFGLHDISKPLSVLVSVFVILLVVNSFNLIDGIDTLAGSIGLLVSSVLAFFFYEMHQTSLTYLSIALSGSLIGFLWYNRTPAKIFMGDTGSLLIGLIISVLCIKFIELNKINPSSTSTPLFSAAPAIVCGLLIIPLFDTIRVFTLRILNGKSPFNADRNHIHHRLLDFNLTHIQSSIILVGINIIFIGITFYFQNIGVVELVIFITFLALSLNVLSWHFAGIKKEQKLALQSLSKSSMDENVDFKIVSLETKLKEVKSRFELNSPNLNSEVLEEVKIQQEAEQILLP